MSRSPLASQRFRAILCAAGLLNGRAARLLLSLVYQFNQPEVDEFPSDGVRFRREGYSPGGRPSKG
jgi:hypothetical protein